MKVLLLIIGIIGFIGFVALGLYVGYHEAPQVTPPPMTELDLEAHEIDAVTERQEDATGKIAQVAIAGYSTIGGLEMLHTFRDIAVIAGIVIIAVMWLKGKKK
jgi:hypothetical protein